MAKDPKAPPRTILTGTAQSVSNSVERARGYFKSHPDATAAPPPKERKNFRRSKPKADEADEVEESEDDRSEGAGETEEGED